MSIILKNLRLYLNINNSKQLPSVVEHHYKVKVGDDFDKITEFLSSPSMVILKSADQKQYEADLTVIDAIERTGLFTPA